MLNINSGVAAYGNRLGGCFGKRKGGIWLVAIGDRRTLRRGKVHKCNRMALTNILYISMNLYTSGPLSSPGSFTSASAWHGGRMLAV